VAVDNLYTYVSEGLEKALHTATELQRWSLTVSKTNMNHSLTKNVQRKRTKPQWLLNQSLTKREKLKNV